MAIAVEDLQKKIAGHDQWAEMMTRDRWQRIDAAVEGHFWSEKLHRALFPQIAGATDTEQIFVEVNAVRPWISAFLAGLSPAGLQSEVTQPLVCAGKRVSPDEVEATSLLLNEFYAREDVEQVMDVALASGLTYDGGGGFYVGRHTRESREKFGLKALPHMLPWVDVVMPWDLLYDREIRKPSDLPFIGRFYWLTIDEYVETFKVSRDEAKKWAGLKTESPSDWARSSATDDIVGSEHWIRMLQLFDLEDVWETTGRGGKRKVSKGTVRYFRLEATTSGPLQGTTPVQIERTEIPFHWDDGEPVVQLIPIALDYVAARPLSNIAAAWGVYELVKELNIICSILATQTRRDQGRIVFIKSDSGLNQDQFKTIWRSGADLSVVEVSGASKLEDIAHVLAIPPAPDTILKLRQFLEGALARVQVTSGASRGQSIKEGTPVSAEEANAVVQGTETQVGRIRDRVNSSTSRLSGAVLRIMVDALEKDPNEKTIDVYIPVSQKEVKLTVETLDRRWNIRLDQDSANPLSTTRQRGEFLQIMKPLEDLVAMATQAEAHPEAAAVGKLAQELIDRAVDLWEMPQGMHWANLAAGIKTPAAPSPAPAGPYPNAANQPPGAM